MQFNKANKTSCLWNSILQKELRRAILGLSNTAPSNEHTSTDFFQQYGISLTPASTPNTNSILGPVLWKYNCYVAVISDTLNRLICAAAAASNTDAGHNRLNRLSKDLTFSRPGLRFFLILCRWVEKEEAFKQIYWLCKSNSRPFFGGKTNISNRNLFPGDEITGRRFVKAITLQKVFSSFTKRASFFADHVFGAFFAAPSKVFFLFCLENLKLLLFFEYRTDFCFPRLILVLRHFFSISCLPQLAPFDERRDNWPLV